MDLGGITLPDSLEWVDEYDHTTVKQDKQFTIGGSLVISENTVPKGRLITLVGGDNVWVEKSTIDALHNLVNTLGGSYTLTLPDARTFTVVFDRDDKPMEAKPLWRKNIQEDTDVYLLTLRLMEI